MRICTPHCGVAPETTSGGETYERELLVRLGRAGARIEIILARGRPYPAEAQNWTVHRFPMGRGLRWWVAPAVVPRAVKRVWDSVGFDLLRVHSLRYIGPSALWARRRFGLDVPVVAHHHHLDPSPLNALIEKRVVEGADAVVVGSEFGRRQLGEDLGARTDHVSVVHYGVDPVFAPRPRRADLVERYGLRGRPAVLFFGGLKPRKNLFLLLDVWSAVVARRPEARLLLAGGGPLLGALRRHARRIGLGESVVFTGYVPDAEKAPHFNLGDVFVFPSAMEGFGLTVAEAMSSAVPVVASDRGSIPELVRDGEAGFLCDPAAPGRFVERLLLLLEDSGLRARLGAAGRERVDRSFRWEGCVDGTRRVYERALEAWRRRGGKGTA
ncbi:MAG: glycosyltransferase family 4 protein [Candidatus Rokubacteria bacterium]|nr:glycosyltransferase family 4 protein [Candidatus Rokubacteria bacterium]